MCKLILVLLAFTFIQKNSAQQQRALLIGIDQYIPPLNEKITSQYRSNFRNLEGCKNDVLSVKSVITTKYGFAEKNVDNLLDAAATHENIISTIKKLLNESKTGDIAFIYYAGHGSQVTNSLSNETDKKDETIVPSDIWKDTIKDIRDKELSQLFNAFIDKHVKLTVIFDCCHSGSISRGNPEFNPPSYRYLDNADYDAKDALFTVPPETRANSDFLIMSAAQDVELAAEQYDENNIAHGAFTLALLNTINQQPVDASAINLFIAARAILKSNGKKQEPVFAGSAERQNETLFGIKKGLLPDKILVPVIENKNGVISLQAGFALSLNKGNELTHVASNNDSLVIKIDSVAGINKSFASVIKGNSEFIEPGELFEVSNWISSDAPLLKLYIPDTKFSYAQISGFANIDNEVKQKHAAWMDNLEEKNPYASIFFLNDSFYYKCEGVIKPISLNKNIILSIVKKDAALYIEIPPPANLVSKIKNRFKQNGDIQIVNNIHLANYTLYGTINDKGIPSYGLRSVETNANDSLESMPLQTKHVDLTQNAGASVADSLYEYAMRLSKIKGWLTIITPSGGAAKFPFHPEILDSATGKEMTATSCKINEALHFHLLADEAATGMSIPKKYIYVFMVDKLGKMLSVYPDENEGNVNNRFPKYSNNNLIEDFPLFDFKMTEPAGTYNFFLLASDEPVQNYAMVFNQQGVRGINSSGNPLLKLLNLGNNEGTRGLTQLPLNWCLFKLSIKATH